MTDAKYFRIRYEITLECQSDVHVGGDDGAKSIEESRLSPYANEGQSLVGKKAIRNAGTTYQPLFRRPSGKTALPAATLRGFLRRLVPDEMLRKKLFGPENIASEQQQGGAARIMDAFLQTDNNAPLPRHASYWHPQKRTALRHGIAMNAAMGVQDGNSLFYHEVWPSGSRFKLKIYLDKVGDREREALSEALMRWDGDLRRNLGARRRKSWGVLRIIGGKYSLLSMKTMKERFSSNGQDDFLAYEKTEELIMPANRATAADIPLPLINKQPLLINDPGQVPEKDTNNGKDKKHKPGDPLPPADHYYFRDGDGKALIPAETMLGFLRASSERLLATWINQRTGDANAAVQEAKKLANEIFGSTGKASLLQWQPAIQQPETIEAHRQHFIAVDRFTGGTSSKKLYIAEAVPAGTRFSQGGLIIHQCDKWEDWQIGLLHAVLEDMRQNKFWLGWGKSKGYGLLCLEMEEASLYRSLLAAFSRQSAAQLKSALRAKLTGIPLPSSPSQENISASPWERKPDVAPPVLQLSQGQNQQQLNPYGFVPVKEMWQSGPVYEELADKGIRHDISLPDRHSGRIRCHLKLCTPTLVGNEHQPIDNTHKPEGSTEFIPLRNGEYTHKVHSYSSGGKLGFPANSLRGMIGTTMETLSQSSLRVLDDDCYSVRKIPDKFRYFHKHNDDKYQAITAVGELFRNPDGGWSIRPLTLPVSRWKPENGMPTLSKKWAQLFEDVPCKERHPVYFSHQQQKSILQHNNQWKKSYGPGNQDTYWIPDPMANESEYKNSLFHSKNNAYLSVFRALGENVLGDTEAEGNIEGYIRYFTKQDNFRRWGLFIPKPSGERKPVPVPKEIMDRFCRINDNKLPELPHGYEWSDSGPQEKMLVFFDIKKNGGNETEVSELSFNAIGREEFSPFSSHDAFLETDGQLLPWGSNKRKASWLTPGEALLGIVEENQQGDKQRNLASRLRFTDALFENAKLLQQDTDIVLKQLASPKPPSPYLYFHEDGSSNKPNGRKAYLRHQSEEVEIHSRDKDNENTRHQKIQCQPLAAGQSAEFDVYFNNLSDEELGLLLLSISPKSDFHHTLGLGKPLGMGQVQIHITEIQLHDYSFETPQTRTCLLDKDFIDDHVNLNLIDKTTFNNLAEIATARPCPIHYPYSYRQNNAQDPEDKERKLYEWHSKNRQKSQPAKLMTLEEADEGKPKLKLNKLPYL
ncbi:TIGR03986 family type III CRISPR-associated RAMP protein [Thiolapillus sp.]